MPLRPFGGRSPQGVFRGLYGHRFLVRQLVWREVQSRYRGSALGLLWSFLTPVLLLGIYTFVFGVVFRARWPGLAQGTLGEYAVVFFCGMVVFGLFSDPVSRAPALIPGSVAYVKRVRFPLEVLPLVSVGAALFHAAAAFAVLLCARVIVRGSLPWTVALAPAVVVPLVLLTVGVCWFLASMGVFVRDLAHVVGTALQVLMLMTPIFYPIEAVPRELQSLVALNPLAPLVDDMRRVVIWGAGPDWPRLAAWTAVDGLVMWLGFSWFVRTKRAFADVV